MTALNIVRPTHPPLSQFSAEFDDAIRRGNLTNNGPYVVGFEDALTANLGVPTLVFSSGQVALMTMLAASGIKGGEIIVPSFTFCATPHAVKWLGCEPCFVDIDPETLCLDPQKVRDAISPKTRAILGVDPYGIQCDANALGAAADGLPIYVDSAPSFGSIGPNRVIDAQIFSFHATKPFSTMEGGALCSLDEEFMDRARCIRNFGQDGSGDCAYLGLNGKMLEVCAMVGLAQLETWPKVSGNRIVAADKLAGALDGIDGLMVIQDPPDQHPIWLYRPVLVDSDTFGMDRDAVVEALKKFDIHVRKYYGACHELSYYRGKSHHLPVTERVASHVISLPVYNDMEDSEIARIAMAFEMIRDGVF